jgi:adenylate kinase family enzyme
MVVIGSTSSGKSTLASRLAEKIGANFIELDALHWEPNWVEAEDEVFRKRVEAAVKANDWVVAGNYHTVRDLVWPKAQAVIWLDYSLPVLFWRLLTRTIRRSAVRERLFSDNIESIWTHLKLWSEDSLFHWLFKTYWRRKREYPQLFSAAQHRHLKVIHFKSPREASEWFACL